MKATLERIVTAWQRSLPGRIVARYGRNNGGLLAGGLAYGLLFAFFAGVWTAFSIAGLIFSNDESVRETLLNAVASFIPSLQSSSGKSILSEKALSSISTTFTVTGLFTLLAFLWQIIGWLGSVRSAVRTMVDVGQQNADAIRSKLRDAVAVMLIMILFVLSSVAAVISGGTIRYVLEFLRIPQSAWGFSSVVDISGFLLTVIFNFLLLLVVFWLVAALRERSSVVRACVFGSLCLSIIQMLGTRLVGGASSNPLLAPFAAILAVLIWFNLIAQVLMYCASLLGETLGRPSSTAAEPPFTTLTGSEGDSSDMTSVQEAARAAASTVSDA
ncbi:YihY/virulence factor BrkB family protein [Bifidobacterium sp.]